MTEARFSTLMRPNPRRYLALFLPFLPVERFLRRGAAPAEGAPFALVEKRANTQRLYALNAAALREGLTPQLSLADARARLPHLLVAPADPSADRALLLRLAGRCERVTPLTALDEPHGLILDMTGCAHLFGGEQGLLEILRADFTVLGFSTRAALAPTPDCARALARFSAGGIFSPEAAEQAVARLPIAALELDEENAVALQRAGLKNLGDIASRATRSFAARFGTDMPQKLQRLFGRVDRRLTPLRPPPDRMVERHFLEPMMQGPIIAAALADLLREIIALLERRGEGGRRFEAQFFRADGQLRTLGVETLRPTRDEKFLARLFDEKFDSLTDPLDPGFGFDALRLSVPRAEILAVEQQDFDGASSSDSERELSELLDRLTTRFGRARVLRFVAGDSFTPEQESRAIPAAEATPQEWPAPEPDEPPARPLTLFDPPQPIEVMALTPDAPPVRFRWRRKQHELRRAEGPERIAPEWGEIPRDYYRVEDAEGRRFWLFRHGLYERGQETPRWFIHGLFA